MPLCLRNPVSNATLRGRHKAIIAVANQLARIVWGVRIARSRLIRDRSRASSRTYARTRQGAHSRTSDGVEVGPAPRQAANAVDPLRSRFTDGSGCADARHGPKPK